jgi:hypothetical protein
MVREYWARAHYAAWRKITSCMHVKTSLRKATAFFVVFLIVGVMAACITFKPQGIAVVVKLLAFMTTCGAPAIYLLTLVCVPAMMEAEARTAQQKLAQRLRRRDKLESCLIGLNEYLVLALGLKKEIICKQSSFVAWEGHYNTLLESIYTTIADGISVEAANTIIKPNSFQVMNTRGYFDERHARLRRHLDKYIERLAHLVQGHYSSLLLEPAGSSPDVANGPPPRSLSCSLSMNPVTVAA